MAILSRHISASETCLGSYPYILDISCMDPKGHIGISQISFRFLWADTDEKRPLVLASKKRISLPKTYGGWGLKNIHLFARALAAKKVYRIISNSKLWARIVKEKHFPPDTHVEWIR